MLHRIKIYLAKKLSDLSHKLCGKKAGTTIIEISGLTEPHKIALEDMLKQWEVMGGLGCSRWTAFYADGDGNFRPKIKIDGRKVEYQKLIDAKRMSRKVEIGEKLYEDRFDADYAIDFDWIAWAMHD